MKRKRHDEHVSNLINWPLDETAADWETGPGTLPKDATSGLNAIASKPRRVLSESLTTRQDRRRTNPRTPAVGDQGVFFRDRQPGDQSTDVDQA